MMFTKIALFSGVVLLFVGAGALEWQKAAGLRAEIAVLRRERHDGARARSMAAETRPVEAAPDDEQEALARLRMEIDQLRRRADERVRATALASGARAAEPEPSMLEQLVPFAAWKNAGRATPAAAMETALWAAAGGDVKTLAATVRLGPVERAKAEKILQRMPVEIRDQFGTPEEFVALLTTQDVPLGEARIVVPPLPPGLPLDTATWRVVQFRGAEEKYRAVVINLRQENGGMAIERPGGGAGKIRGDARGPDDEGSGQITSAAPADSLRVWRGEEVFCAVIRAAATYG